MKEEKRQRNFMLSVLVFLLCLYFVSSPIDNMLSFNKILNNESMVFEWDEFLNVTELDQEDPIDMFFDIYFEMSLVAFWSFVCGISVKVMKDNWPRAEETFKYM